MPTVADLRASAECAAIALDALQIGPRLADAVICRRSVGDIRRAILDAYRAGQIAPAEEEAA